MKSHTLEIAQSIINAKAVDDDLADSLDEFDIEDMIRNTISKIYKNRKKPLNNPKEYISQAVINIIKESVKKTV